MNPYNPTPWQDDIYDQETGELIQEGTPMSRTQFYNMETGILGNNILGTYLLQHIFSHISNKENPHCVTAEQVGSISKTLLWENAIQSSQFLAQSVAIPTEGYDAFDIVFIDSLINRFVTTQRIEQHRQTDASMYYRLSMIYDNRQYYRDFTLGSSGFNFSQGAILQPSSSPSWGDNYAIPIRIYGIKGVK